MMDALFWWSGAVVWSAACACVVWYVGFELLVVGVANSISWHRWRLSSRKPGWRWSKYWWPVVRSVMWKALEFWGYRSDSGRFRYSDDHGGYWEGIGSWRPASPHEGKEVA